VTDESGLPKREAPAPSASRSPLPWHPVGFAAAYVLNAYVVTSVSPYAMFRGLFVAVAIAAIAIGLASVAFRNLRRGALVATALVAFIVLGREVAKIVENAATLLTPWQSVAFAIAIGVALGLALRVAWRSLRRPDGLARWTRGLNALAAILLLVVVVAAVANGTPGHSIADLRQGVPLQAAPDRPSVAAEGPDIYLILLDGHARGDVLADRFGFDDTPFLDDLRARGFEVAPGSHSNYMLTQLTLTSMFQMALLDDVKELDPVIAGVASNAVARRALNDNPTFSFLRSHGYTTVAFASPYEDVTLRQADIFIDSPQLTEFEWQLFASTFALDVVNRVAPNLFPDAQRERIDAAFKNLVAVARDTQLGPRFVFAHVLAPHTPLVFGPNGEPLDVPVLRRTDDTAAGLGFSDAEFARRFTGQTTYVDKRAIEAIDAVLAASPRPPIIILMSDHGSRSRPLVPATATPEDLRERFGTLFAAYTPGKSGVFPDDVTPAEICVDLLNAYFGANRPQPPNGTFISDASHPFQFTRVPEPPPPN
jgi:hypothetical protein